MKLTDAEWSVLEVLWSGERFSLGEITEALQPVHSWSKKTVFTYLSRMETKGLILADRTRTRPYAAAVTKEDCAREERDALLQKVYGGAAGDLIAAFLKESVIPEEELRRLKKLLDEMEV